MDSHKKQCVFQSTLKPNILFGTVSNRVSPSAGNSSVLEIGPTAGSANIQSATTLLDVFFRSDWVAPQGSGVFGDAWLPRRMRSFSGVFFTGEWGNGSRKFQRLGDHVFGWTGNVRFPVRSKTLFCTECNLRVLRFIQHQSEAFTELTGDDNQEIIKKKLSDELCPTEILIHNWHIHSLQLNNWLPRSPTN